MLTTQQRNDRFAIIAALQGADTEDPLVRAVICDIQQMNRRAREQIAFVGDVPEFIYMPPVSSEAERVALAIWSGQFHHAISWQVQNAIQLALELHIGLETLPQEPKRAWLS
jgi:hypothetical protein